MARLPDVTDLGARPVPRSQRQIATVRNAGAVGDAIAGFGDTASNIGQQMLEREDKLSYAAAKTALLKADATTRQELEDDPDYSTYEKRYQEKMGGARTLASSLIKSRSDRRTFEVDTQMDLDRGTVEVRKLASARKKAAGLATMLDASEDLLAVSRNAKDDGTRQAAITAANDLFNGAVANGSLDPVKGVEARRSWHSRYIGQQVISRLDDGDMDGARGLIDRMGQYLDDDSYMKLSAAIDDEGDAKAVLGAADVAMGSPMVEAPKDVPGLVKSLFPGAHITDSGIRTGALAAANPKSYHNRGQGMDIRAIPGVTFDEFVTGLKAAGVPVVEAIDEYKNPSKHATGGHWHVAWTNQRSAAPKTVDEAITRAVTVLGPNATVKQIEGARAEVLKRWQTKEASEGQREESAVESAQAALMKNGGNWYALPPSIRSSVNPKYVPSLINFGEGLAPSAPKRVTDPSTYVKLSDMAAQSPREFLKINPIEYRSALDDGDWNRMVALRASIMGKGDEGASISNSAVRSIIDPLRKSKGLTTIGLDEKKDKDKIQSINGRIYNLEKTVTGDLAIWQQNNPGKKPTTADIQKIADARMIAFVQGDETRFGFEASGEGKVVIPRPDADRISKLMAPILGRAPTGTEVYAAFIAEARQ